jgi:hypothetical protein
MLHAILLILLIILVALVIDRLSPGLLHRILSVLWSAFKSLFKFVVVIGIVVSVCAYVYDTYEAKKQQEINAKYEKEREEFEFKQRAEAEERQRQEALEAKRQQINAQVENDRRATQSIIENAMAEIKTTQSYNVVFAAQLVEAQSQNDKDKVNRILSNMSQNNQWIKQQRLIINNNTTEAQRQAIGQYSFRYQLCLDSSKDPSVCQNPYK